MNVYDYEDEAGFLKATAITNCGCGGYEPDEEEMDEIVNEVEGEPIPAEGWPTVPDSIPAEGWPTRVPADVE